MKVSEIIKIIKDNDLQKPLMEFDGSSSDFIEYFDDKEFEEKEEALEYLKSLGLETIEFKASVCNSDEMYTILQINGIFLKLEGEYDSYGQYEHDYDCGITEVFPKQVTQTIYEAKK